MVTTETQFPGHGERSGPLAGLRVLDLGQLIAGPFCGQLLGDLGAEVIKVEAPATGDAIRTWGQRGPNGEPLTWAVIARNKKSVTVDLRQAAGQAVVRALADSADIVIENFRPGTLERWNLGPSVLWQTNPGLIVVRVSGFGQDGPYAERAGFGAIGEAMGGLRYVTGDADRPPSRVGISIGDSLAGCYAALGALAALQARHRTGRGQVVDSAIYEAVLAMMEASVTEWSSVGHQRERSGSILRGIAPSNVYPTADGEEILIAGNQDSVFRRLTEVMDQPEMAGDARFATHTARGEHQAELDEIIADWTRHVDSETLLARLAEAGVPAGKVFRAADMLADKHFAARNAIVEVTDGSGHSLSMQGVFPRLSETPGSVAWPGPGLGERTDEVLLAIGYSHEELQRLRGARVI